MGIGYGVLLMLSGDVLRAGASLCVAGFLFALMVSETLQYRVLGRAITVEHAFYLAIFWAYSQGWIVLLRQLQMLPQVGKDSTDFYIVFIFFCFVTYRAIFALFGMTRIGYRVLFTTVPLWERLSITLNELLVVVLLSVFGGGLLARVLQPNVLTLQIEFIYTYGVLDALAFYFFAIQLMGYRRFNRILSYTHVWVRLARGLAPLALFVATVVIARYFTRLSDPRTADLLGRANFDQTVLAISPLVWLLILAIVILVYTSRRGLSYRFFPDVLLEQLPSWGSDILRKLSDMDMLLLLGILSMWIPVQVLLTDGGHIGALESIRAQITQQNALIDTSEQALALIFALPFYFVVVGILAIYAYVLNKSDISARDRDALVDQLPIGLLIMFIITLYLCAIPFSQVLSEGRLPQLPQDLGRILAFDVLIPLVLLYGHYFLLVRFPYARGQKVWRMQYADRLQGAEARVQQQINLFDAEIKRIERRWVRIKSEDDKLDTLYKYVELNSKRDSQNMDLLRLIRERQELDAVSDTPVSVAIAHLPTRIISLGVPLLLAFKIYEWAVVNNGLREIANNPNIGVIEFFQIILQQTQF
jgi:hypothetical protein